MARTIQVTQDDIDLGEPGNCDRCPGALALNHQLGGQWSVFDDLLWRFTDDGPCDEFEIPRELRDFADDFDNLRPVSPFSFDLNVPEGK